MPNSEDRNARPVKTGFRSLSPAYVEDEHGYYVRQLHKILSPLSRPRNVALSGGYGTGKSSILDGLRSTLDKESVLVISLATMNQTADQIEAATGEKSLAASLQKEIVKRILFSADPKDLPDSRIERIAPFSWTRNLIRAGVVAGLVLLLGLLIDVPPWLGGVVGEWPGQPWASLVAATLFVFAVALGASRLLSMVRLREISVGPARLTLSDSSGNYFDEYLDEIVYFFKRTGTNFVFFEDLDRFDDLSILLSLRELNSVVNLAMPQRSIVFVYAVGQTVFDADSASVLQASESDQDTAQAEPSKLGATSFASARTKFFDLIVPVVPFSSTEVAQDLFLRTFQDSTYFRDLDPRIFAIAGSYITDMRVILSIANEFSVYADQLLANTKIVGLSSNELLGMLLYKHSYPRDYEEIFRGTSDLHALIKGRNARTERRLAQIQERRVAAQAEFSLSEEQARTREQAAEVVRNSLRFVGRAFDRDTKGVRIGGASINIEDLAESGFWAFLAAAEPETTIQIESSQGATEWPLDETGLRLLLGKMYPIHDWYRSGPAEEAASVLADCDLRSQRLRTESLAEFVRDLSVSHAVDPEGERLADLPESLLAPGLARDLIIAGFIDHKFGLYVARFHGEITSAAAMSYKLLYVDTNSASADFVLSPSDVQQLLTLTNWTLPDSVAALNVSIVDTLLSDTDGSYGEALARTSLSQNEPERSEFIIAYCLNGRDPEQFLRYVTPTHPTIVDVIVTSPQLSEDRRQTLLATTLKHLSTDVPYELSMPGSTKLQEALDNEHEVLKHIPASSKGEALANFLQRSDLRIGQLQQVHESLRLPLISRGVVRLNRTNLDLCFPGQLSLDHLRTEHPKVAELAVRRSEEYVAALAVAPATYAVEDPLAVADVLHFVAHTEPSALEAVVASLPRTTRLRFSDIPTVAFQTVASMGMIEPTADNLVAYLQVYPGLEGPIVPYLESQESLSRQGENLEPTELAAIVTALLSSQDLSSESKVRLVRSLDLKSPIDPTDVNLHEPLVVTELLKSRLLPDSPTTFLQLDRSDWKTMEAAIVAAPGFTTYLQHVGLDDTELGQLFASRDIPTEVKDSALASLPDLGVSLSPDTCESAVRYALRAPVALSFEAVRMLIDGKASENDLIEYVARARHLTPDQTLDLLKALGGEFASLGDPQSPPVDLPGSEALVSILQRLRDAKLIGNFRKRPDQLVYRVDTHI